MTRRECSFSCTRVKTKTGSSNCMSHSKNRGPSRLLKSSCRLDSTLGMSLTPSISTRAPLPCTQAAISLHTYQKINMNLCAGECITYPDTIQHQQAIEQYVAAKPFAEEQTCKKVRKALVAKFMAWFQRCTSGGPPPPPAASLSFTLMFTCSLLLLVSCQSKTADGNCLQRQKTGVTESRLCPVSHGRD